MKYKRSFLDTVVRWGIRIFLFPVYVLGLILKLFDNIIEFFTHKD